MKNIVAKLLVGACSAWLMVACSGNQGHSVAAEAERLRLNGDSIIETGDTLGVIYLTAVNDSLWELHRLTVSDTLDRVLCRVNGFIVNSRGMVFTSAEKPTAGIYDFSEHRVVPYDTVGNPARFNATTDSILINYPIGLTRMTLDGDADITLEEGISAKAAAEFRRVEFVHGAHLPFLIYNRPVQGLGADNVISLYDNGEFAGYIGTPDGNIYIKKSGAKATGYSGTLYLNDRCMGTITIDTSVKEKPHVEVKGTFRTIDGGVTNFTAEGNMPMPQKVEWVDAPIDTKPKSKI